MTNTPKSAERISTKIIYDMTNYRDVETDRVCFDENRLKDEIAQALREFAAGELERRSKEIEDRMKSHYEFSTHCCDRTALKVVRGICKELREGK